MIQISHNFTFAQTAPFSDLPVAERRGKMERKRRRVEMEKTEEMRETGEVEKVPSPLLKKIFRIGIEFGRFIKCISF